MEKVLMPAAQHLRMSTEHQQYSFANQSRCDGSIRDGRGFQMVKTYSDGARSGLRINKLSWIEAITERCS